MPTIKIASLDIATTVNGYEFLVIDDGVRTRRATIFTITNTLSTDVARSLTSSFGQLTSGSASIEYANEIDSSLQVLNTTVQSSSAAWGVTGNITNIYNIDSQDYTILPENFSGYIRKSFNDVHTIYVPTDNNNFTPGASITIRNAGLSALTILPLNSNVVINYDNTYAANVIDPKNTAQLLYIGDNNWDLI
jgi:hypothetical protein